MKILNDQQFCVLNKGFTSIYFNLEKGSCHKGFRSSL